MFPGSRIFQGLSGVAVKKSIINLCSKPRIPAFFDYKYYVFFKNYLKPLKLFIIFVTFPDLRLKCDRIVSMKKKTVKHRKSLLTCICIAVVFVTIINLAVIKAAEPFIISSDKAYELSARDGEFDCILVLGASVSQYGPSPILANRLDKGLELFSLGVSNIMLLSGDNGTIEYNEVQAMKEYVLGRGSAAGLTANNVYLDYAGFSTYYSAVRGKEIFGAERLVIVTQRYHLYRAVFNARMIGLDAYGVAAEDVIRSQVVQGTIREIPARVKDFFLTLISYTPRIMGDPVPLVYPSTQ